MNTITTLLLSALVPLLIGFIYYHPKVFGKFWMRVAEVTEEKLKTGNFIGILIMTYVLGFFISALMMSMVIHQAHMYSIFADSPDSAEIVKEFMSKYGDLFRTFKHGAFHGVLVAVLFVTPIIGINAMFERRGFKYILVHAGYWIITLALMGGLICQFAMRD
jgi:hypothetical protein